MIDETNNDIFFFYRFYLLTGQLLPLKTHWKAISQREEVAILQLKMNTLRKFHIQRNGFHFDDLAFTPPCRKKEINIILKTPDASFRGLGRSMDS